MRIDANSAEIATYRAMLNDNLCAPAIYSAGTFWDQINKDFADLIWSGALRDLRNQYFSRRFAAWDPHDRTAYRCLLRLYREQLRARDTEGFLDQESDPMEGGADDQENIDGRRVSLDFLQSVDEALSIKEAWRLSGRGNGPRLLVELGAGYGRLAYVMCRMFPECTYVICDLPEALACADSWLSRVLPGKVVPYAESRGVTSFSRETLISRKCWILGAHQIEALPSNSLDAFVNIYSFAEMPRTTIAHYFKEIDRVTRGVVFIKQRKREENLQDAVIVTADSYPVPTTWQPVFFRTTPLYEEFFEAAWSTGLK